MMPRFKSESLPWYDQLKALRAQSPDASPAELMAALNLSKSQVSDLQAIDKCFDLMAVEKAHTLSLNSVRTLASLMIKAEKTDPTTIHAVLDVILSHQLKTSQMEALVAWVISGNPAAEFDPKLKTVEPLRHQGTKESDTKKGTDEDRANNESIGKNDPLDLKKVRQLLEKAEAERIEGKETTQHDKLVDYLRKVFGASPKTSQKGSNTDEVLSETVLLDWLADLPILARIKTKRKKKQSLTAGEICLLVLHKIGEGIGHLCKLILKVIKPLLKFLHTILKLVIEALKELGIYKWVKAVFTLVMLVVAIWFAWEAFHYGVMKPVEMIWSKIHFPHFFEESTMPVPTAQPIPSASSPQDEKQALSVPISHKKEIGTPAMVYKPSIAFVPTVYDPKLLEQEIAAIPDNSVIKDYVFQPDEGMPADLAASRLQDLTDADKYTMMIGNSKEKILSVSPSHTNFTLAYKGTDLFNVWGSGSGEMNFFWEDVKYIHANVIYTGPLAQSNPAAQLVASPQMHVIYQCSLVVKGAKNPLTIQCASTDDLQNLVSTMEFFIRNSRLGHDAQPAGLPYPSQGLVFNNLCVVQKLWANSPADRAGLQLTDHLWSLAKAAGDPQEKKDFEKGLQTLPATLFVASDADWAKANIAKNSGMTTVFRPRLRKIILPL